MKLQLLGEHEYAAWDRFVSRTENATLFHTAWWHHAWGINLTIYARKNPRGEIEAGLPIHRSRFLGVTAISRPPLSPLNGPIFPYASNTNNYSQNIRIQKEFFAALGSCPIIWGGFDTQVIYTYVIPKCKSASWRKDMSERHLINLTKAHKEMRDYSCNIEMDSPFTPH